MRDYRKYGRVEGVVDYPAKESFRFRLEEIGVELRLCVWCCRTYRRCQGGMRFRRDRSWKTWRRVQYREKHGARGNSREFS